MYVRHRVERMGMSINRPKAVIELSSSQPVLVYIHTFSQTHLPTYLPTYLDELGLVGHGFLGMFDIVDNLIGQHALLLLFVFFFVFFLMFLSTPLCSCCCCCRKMMMMMITFWI